MSSISWTLLHVCGGADISRVEQEQEQEQVEVLECRTEGWEARRGNRNVLLHDEELINVFQPSCSCSFVCTQIRHRAQRHRPTRRPTDRELKIHVAIHRGPCVYRWRGHGYAFPLSLSTSTVSMSVCICTYVLCNNRISVSSPGEERYRPLKAIYFSDHLPKARERSWFPRSRPHRPILLGDSLGQRYS